MSQESDMEDTTGYTNTIDVSDPVLIRCEDCKSEFGSPHLLLFYNRKDQKYYCVDCSNRISLDITMEHFEIAKCENCSSTSKMYYSLNSKKYNKIFLCINCTFKETQKDQIMIDLKEHEIKKLTREINNLKKRKVEKAIDETNKEQDERFCVVM